MNKTKEETVPQFKRRVISYLRAVAKMYKGEVGYIIKICANDIELNYMNTTVYKTTPTPVKRKK